MTKNKNILICKSCNCFYSLPVGDGPLQASDTLCPECFERICMDCVEDECLRDHEFDWEHWEYEQYETERAIEAESV